MIQTDGQLSSLPWNKSWDFSFHFLSWSCFSLGHLFCFFLRGDTWFATLGYSSSYILEPSSSTLELLSYGGDTSSLLLSLMEWIFIVILWLILYLRGHLESFILVTCSNIFWFHYISCFWRGVFSHVFLLLFFHFERPHWCELYCFTLVCKWVPNKA